MSLLRRWRRLAKSARLQIREYFEEGGVPYVVLESKPSAIARPALYLSAGIHGDEAGGTEGLIAWAELHTLQLQKLNLMIFPCLNPWGLVNNVRTDAIGVDRNRSYHDHSVPATRAHLDELHGRRFDAALVLHEDFDAQGVYIYEIQRRRPSWGPELLLAASEIISPDPRPRIETSRSKLGLIRRKISKHTMEQHPEAFSLHFHHADRTFTIETPSEHALPVRVSAHVAIIKRAVELLHELK